MSYTGQFDIKMDMWDTFWQVYVKHNDAPFEVCHFKYIWCCQFIFFNKLSFDNSYKLKFYPQNSRPGLVNADRPFVCQSVWNSWMGNILNNKTHSTGHWPLIMALTVAWDTCMFVHNTYSFALDLSWTLERANVVENPFNHLTSTLIVSLWHFLLSHNKLR